MRPKTAVQRLRLKLRAFAAFSLLCLVCLFRRFSINLKKLFRPASLVYGLPNASNILDGGPKDLRNAPRINIAQHIVQSMRKNAASLEAVFMHDFTHGIKLTCGQALDLTEKLRKALQFHGFNKQDSTLAFLRNRVEYPCVFFATVLNQGIFATAVTSCTEENLAHQIANASPKFIFVEEELLPRAQTAVALCAEQKLALTTRPTFVVFPPLPSGLHSTTTTTTLPNVEQKRNRSATQNQNDCKNLPVLTLAEFLETAAENTQPLVDPDKDLNIEEDVAVLLYTSGTTGPPKGVALTHRALADRYCSGWRKIPFASINLHTPMCHQLAFCMMCFYAAPWGKTFVFTQCPPFEAEEIFRCFDETEPYFIIVTPPIMIMLMKNPLRHKYVLNSFPTAAFGGSPFGRQFAELWTKTYPQCCLNRQAYGSTEFSELGVLLPEDILMRRDPKHGSSGRVLPGAKFKICDLKTGKAVGPNVRGEFRVQNGADMLKCYWKMPEKTRAYYDDEGFIRTGDYGYYDSDGYIFVLERVDDLIFYSPTEIICPSEIEGRLIAHESVADVGVVGVEILDEDGGKKIEVPRAYVVLNDGVPSATVEELMEFANEQCDRYYELLRGGLKILTTLPRSTASKIQKNVLRSMAEQDLAGSANI